MIMRSTLGSLYRHTLLLSALVACALLTTLARSLAADHVSTEWGVDRLGGDLGLGFETPDAEQCRQACADNAQCMAYTYAYPGVKGPKGLCFLKSSVPAPIADNCCISGVKKGWRSGPYSLKQKLGEMKIPLDPSSTHMCVLTRVSGKFMGGGEKVRVFVGNDKRWYLEVDNHSSQGVAGTAFCFWKGGFVAGGANRQISHIFEAREKQAVKTEDGSAATVLAGVNGHLRGGGEHARIVQADHLLGRSELRVGSAAGFLKAWAYSFFAGSVDFSEREQAKFFNGPQGEFKLDHVNIVSPRSVDMAPTADAMCYFTRLQGRFNGMGEWAEIVPFIDSNGVERWRLRAQAQGDSEVFAAARCYLRKQR
jgi:PAN domain